MSVSFAEMFEQSQVEQKNATRLYPHRNGGGYQVRFRNR